MLDAAAHKVRAEIYRIDAGALRVSSANSVT